MTWVVGLFSSAEPLYRGQREQAALTRWGHGEPCEIGTRAGGILIEVYRELVTIPTKCHRERYGLPLGHAAKTCSVTWAIYCEGLCCCFSYRSLAPRAINSQQSQRMRMNLLKQHPNALLIRCTHKPLVRKSMHQTNAISVPSCPPVEKREPIISHPSNANSSDYSHKPNTPLQTWDSSPFD